MLKKHLLLKDYQEMCNNRYDTSVRLWDAVGGFLFLFANMQDKLSKHSSQLDLLKELLNLQKDMVIMMLSMLEGKIIFFDFFWSKVTSCIYFLSLKEMS